MTSADPRSPPRARWCLGTRLVVAATAAWTVYVLAHALLHGRWWLWMVAEFAPPLIMVLVPLALLAVVPLARPVRRPLSVLLAALLVLGVPMSGLTFGVPEAGAAGSGARVTFFTWNTDVWTQDKDPGEFFAFLRSKRADVYLLQEYLFWDDARGGPLKVDDTARLRAEFPGYHVVAEGELVTLSRLPVVATYPRAVPQAGTDWYWRGNKAQRVDIRAGATTLTVYNVHLFVPWRRGTSPLGAEFYRFAGEQYTLRQRELSALRADTARNPLPAVIAGDFNSPWMGLDRMAGLGPRFRRADPTAALYPSSWPATDYPFPRVWRLDWVFAGTGARVSDYRFEPAGALSDHLGQAFSVAVG
ncbi:endonuclease/exonuclease/phosphatase family protein [Sphaerisporangium aureirubrum]|uniref:Endonuclease/exonuclease/phosphatase family protein n=1 Tax=Sphaerisporangium aureirubrum TaxID=1544736 RepID=A0ABW1NIG8_9ACTN